MTFTEAERGARDRRNAGSAAADLIARLRGEFEGRFRERLGLSVDFEVGRRAELR